MSEQDDTAVETDDVDTDLVDDSDDGDTGDTDKLGDAGKKALDSMKSKWQKERDARKALEAKLTAADNKDDQTQDPAELRKQAQAEARAEVLKERALDKVEAKAARLFADPEDARALLATRVDDFVDDGQVDVDAINEALTDLLSKKPHLAAATAKRFQGGADGGARKGSQVSQLTEQDLTRMTPQQIDKARLDGRLNDLLGVT
jgi:membrane protein involved in colicin uptake